MELRAALKKKIIFILSLIMMFRLVPLRIAECIGQFFPEDSTGCKIRGYLYKPFLKKCGKNFQVSLRVKLENLNKIEIGDDVYVGYGSWLNGFKDGIILEDEVMLGPYVTIVANNHTKFHSSYRFGPGSGGKVHIGKGTWLASKVTVIAGVSIGIGVLVAANAVVTKDIDSNVKVAGIPARKI